MKITISNDLNDATPGGIVITPLQFEQIVSLLESWGVPGLYEKFYSNKANTLDQANKCRCPDTCDYCEEMEAHPPGWDNPPGR